MPNVLVFCILMGMCLTQQGITQFIKTHSIVKTIVQLEQHKQTNTNSNTLANLQIILNHNFKKTIMVPPP
jgi:uncharacterized membrane protein